MRRRKDVLVAVCFAVLLHTAVLLYAVLAVPPRSREAAGSAPGRRELSVVVTIETPPPKLPPVAAAPVPEPAPAPDPPPAAEVSAAPAPEDPMVPAFQGPPAPAPLPAPAPEPAPSIPGVAAESSARQSSGVNPPPLALPAEVTENPASGEDVPVVWSGDLDIRPRYPMGSRRRGEEGLVRLLVRVLPSGRAEKVDVATTSGYPALDQAAVDAVKKARFPMRDMPTGSGGEILLSFRFQLVESAL